MEAIGYKIKVKPSRGADNGIDMVVEETIKGINTITIKRWMVSCKHFAKSKKNVSAKHELDIESRLTISNCDGFIGFYSTGITNSFETKLSKNYSKYPSFIYNKSNIESILLRSKQRKRLLASYFPNSYKNYLELKRLENNTRYRSNFNQIERSLIKNTFVIDEKILLRNNLTAIILIDIEKIKEEFERHDWEIQETILYKFYKYEEYSNELISNKILEFLEDVSTMTRSNMPSEIAYRIETLVMAYFPSNSDTINKELLINNGKKCAYIANNLIYDAFIYLNNFQIACYGFTILKHVYNEAIQKNLEDVLKELQDTYKRLEETLNRPERNELQNAKDLLNIFKKDLKIKGNRFPKLPDYLYELYIKD